MRHVHHFVPRVNDPYEENQTMEVIPSNGSPLAMFVPGAAAIGKSADLKTVSHEAATAVWWTPPKDVSQGTFLRHLEGEIHLGADLQPSCACEIFRIEASFILFYSSNHIPKNKTLWLILHYFAVCCGARFPSICLLRARTRYRPNWFPRKSSFTAK